MRLFIKGQIAALFITIFANSAFACDEQKTLALNIYHEARAESLEGKLMVAEVVFNRVKNKKFPDTICGVIYHKGQFDWVSQKLTVKDQITFKEIYELSGDILEGGVDMPNSDALFFKAKGVRSKFHESRKFLGTVGNHQFYK